MLRLETIKTGVPQGSILGPLLFVIFVNDLPDAIQDLLVSYADDSAIVVAGTSHEQLRENTVSNINKVHKWCRDNSLTLNIEKTKIVNFHFSYQSSVGQIYDLEDCRLRSDGSAKFLGIIVDERLAWSSHVEGVAAKLNALCFQLRTLRDCLPLRTCLSVYHSNVESALQYGILAWGGACDLPRLLILQKRCLRILFRLSSLDSCKPYFIQHKLLTVVSLYILRCAIFVKENQDLFLSKRRDHLYFTRNREMLLPSQTQFSQYYRNVNGLVIRVYNRLPRSLTVLPLMKMKRALKHFLHEKAYYSLNEFLTNSVEFTE